MCSLLLAGTRFDWTGRPEDKPSAQAGLQSSGAHGELGDAGHWSGTGFAGEHFTYREMGQGEEAPCLNANKHTFYEETVTAASRVTQEPAS